MPNPGCDVLIAGAGPVGLTMAAVIRHHGLSCRIIDQAPAPSERSKALVVWSRTLELLDRLDLADTFVRAGKKARGASIYGQGRRLVRIEMQGAESPFGFPLMIPQNETERILAEHLERVGIPIERNVELVSFREDAGRVVGTLRQTGGRDASFEASWLVGCDGAHSTVRHVLGIEFTGYADPNDWMLADVHMDGPIADDEISIYWHEQGVLAVFPIAAGRFRVIADLGTRPSGTVIAEPTLSQVQARVDERGPAGLVLSHPIWLTHFRIHERKVSEYRRGRVFLAGDAAHIHSPAGGQGMNTGMQDAFNLAWKLALVHRGLGQVEPLLGSYTIERSAVGDQVLRAAERLTLAATLRNPMAQWLRNHIAPVVTSFGFVQDKIRDSLCELSINYRHGPLSEEAWPWSPEGLVAGDRMCDARLTAPDGRASTLFAVFRPPCHALFLLPGSDDVKATADLLRIADVAVLAHPGVLGVHMITSAAPDAAVTDRRHVSVWRDTEGRVYQKLRAAGHAIVLVRPDGYIGYRCQPADADSLLRYLGHYLISAPP